eukprot:CAMPEP_0169172234 /NCGR_PEP_ID=MMETSP1015-20121227/63207_1 /TAXON_ID=342587 /ORGANISM="Karlodinium micrum, Strain CCMP2283" /LENGTH=38 /DNA_ID= /DNA_START= /DNA_END= /DNA_ORIENTATION=
MELIFTSAKFPVSALVRRTALRAHMIHEEMAALPAVGL